MNEAAPAASCQCHLKRNQIQKPLAVACSFLSTSNLLIPSVNLSQCIQVLLSAHYIYRLSFFLVLEFLKLLPHCCFPLLALPQCWFPLLALPQCCFPLLLKITTSTPLLFSSFSSTPLLFSSFTNSTPVLFSSFTNSTPVLFSSFTNSTPCCFLLSAFLCLTSNGGTQQVANSGQKKDPLKHPETVNH